MKTRYEIEIDQLVLDGIPAGQRRAIGKAVERELSRLAGEGGFAPGEVRQIPPIRLPGKGEPTA